MSKEIIFEYWKNQREPKVGDRADYYNPYTGYMEVEFDGQVYSSHYIAWILFYNETPKGKIEHINGNKTDNRIQNLRIKHEQE